MLDKDQWEIDVKDFFLSHASEEKALVRKVHDTLQKKGFTCWLDEAEILPGDSLVDKVFRQGIKKSRFVILFISRGFLSKGWLRSELETVVAKQIREKKTIVVSFLLRISHQDLVEQYPFFENIYCGEASEFDLMITQLKNLMLREDKPSGTTAQSENRNVSSLRRSPQDDNAFDFDIINIPALFECTRLRETFRVTYHRAPGDMQVEIVEYSPGSYYGICNYGFWGPEQATPYRSMHIEPSIVEALNDAIEGIHAFDSSEYPNELVFWISEQDVIFDGNGARVDKEEAHARRSRKAKNYKKIDWTHVTLNGGPWWLISKNFTAKKFSVHGPIENDNEYIKKCTQFQDKGIDFRIETVPVNRKSKERIEKYFQEMYSMKIVAHADLYDDSEGT